MIIFSYSFKSHFSTLFHLIATCMSSPNLSFPKLGNFLKEKFSRYIFKLFRPLFSAFRIPIFCRFPKQMLHVNTLYKLAKSRSAFLVKLRCSFFSTFLRLTYLVNFSHFIRFLDIRYDVTSVMITDVKAVIQLWLRSRMSVTSLINHKNISNSIRFCRIIPYIFKFTYIIQIMVEMLKLIINVN